MSFLAPIAFWFLALLPVVVVFYLLKRKRMVKLVSSTLLWQRFLAESQASAPFQKLRKNWLLLLQLLALLLVVLALARPFLPSQARPAQRRVVILDASASMKATDVKPSRFDRAREEAIQWVGNLRSGEEMVIVQAGAETLVRQSATRDRNALRRAIDACAPSDGPTRLVPALQMAESLTRDQSGAEIHLFSDGATGAMGEFENRGLPLVFHKIGSGSNNLAITAIDSRMNPANPAERAVYVSVANFSGEPRKAEIELLFEETLVELRPLDIAPGESSSQVFIVRQERDGIHTVNLKVEDDLAVDNRASIGSLLPKPVHILLVTAGNRLLEKALRAAPRAEVAVAPTLNDSSRGFDVVVLDGVPPLVWPEGNVLAFCVWQTNWFSDPARVEAPSLVDWRATHPLLRYAGFDDVGVSESLAVRAPTWAVSLLDSPQASLMLAGELGRQKIVWAGFDSLDSNWPLRISFPIFIANAVEWLSPAGAQGGQLMVKTGEPFRCPLAAAATGAKQPRAAQVAEVTTPSSAAQKIAMETSATEFVYGRTLEQGVYKARLGTNQFSFCANLLDSQESNISPKDELSLGPRARVAAAGARRASVEFWRVAAALGLLLLLGEWWYYHKRTA